MRTSNTKSWIVEPFLHCINNGISNPMTDRFIGTQDSDHGLILKLRNGELAVADIPEHLLRGLIDDKWLIDPGTDPARRFHLKYVSLEANTQCNQACYFCPVAYKPREPHFMPMTLYENILRQLATYRHSIEGVSMIHYNEPTIDKRFVQQVELVKAHGLPPAVLSNGSGLTPKCIDRLIDLGGLHYLSVNLSTLDGNRYMQDRGHNHVDQVIRNLDYMKALPVAKQMEIVVLGRGDPVFKRDVKAIEDRFAGSRFVVKSFMVMDRAGQLPFGLKPQTPHRRSRGCEVVGSRPLQWLHITAHGRCVFCCQDYDEDYVVGDLNKQTIDEVLGGEKFAKLRRWAYGLEKAPKDFICHKCHFALTD